MSRKQLVLDAFDNKKVDRVPTGFWFHFAEGAELFNAPSDPSIITKNIEGHKRFFNEYHPDFIKLMSDGYFGYPNEAVKNVKTAADLSTVKPIGADHPWITAQAELVKKLTDIFGDEVATFYNIFSAATFFRFLIGGPNEANGEKRLADLILEDKEAVKRALDAIASDLAALSDKVIKDGKATGIYLSVKNVQDPRVDSTLYREVVTPSDKKVLAAANDASKYNILHICGYEGSRNDLSVYKDYDVKAINWAVTVEGVSLTEGKKLFGGRTVIGGFNNTKQSPLYIGSQEEIQSITKNLIKEAGDIGVIIGADCTIPNDIKPERLAWVREAAQGR